SHNTTTHIWTSNIRHQAEDGIRDFPVTGVQTCALPISVAREQGVPAYIVFGDATLRGIAVTKPASLDELGTISGVGEKKLEAYEIGRATCRGRVRVLADGVAAGRESHG